MFDPSEKIRDTIRDVFISSTGKDLKQEREKAKDAIWRASMYPRAMEIGDALPIDALEASLGWVDKAEIYVGIFAYRYGYIPDDPRNPNKVSITELEYRRALERKIPILIFMPKKKPEEFTGTMDELETCIEQDPEKRAKLDRLRDELLGKYVVAFYENAVDLGMRVFQSLHTDELQVYLAELAAQDEPVPELDGSQQMHHPRSGLIPEEKDGKLPLYVPHPYILTRQFFGRKAELKQLDEWAKSTDTTMIVESIGGMGKSALTWEWVGRQGEKYDGLVWWSFYESDGVMSNFIRHTLSYLTGKPIEEFNPLSRHEREIMLLEVWESGVVCWCWTESSVL